MEERKVEAANIGVRGESAPSEAEQFCNFQTQFQLIQQLAMTFREV